MANRFIPRNLEIKPKPLNEAGDSLNWKPSKEEYDFLWGKGFKCDCCGLVSKPHKKIPSGYMEICSILGKKVLLCSVCSQSQHIGRKVNDNLNHGFVVYCPEFTQGQLTTLVLHTFSMLGSEDMLVQKNAKLVIRELQNKRASLVQNIIPDYKSGSISEFTRFLEELSLKIRSEDNYSKLMSGLRYIPNQLIFEKQITFWRMFSPDFSEAG